MCFKKHSIFDDDIYKYLSNNALERFYFYLTDTYDMLRSGIVSDVDFNLAFTKAYFCICRKEKRLLDKSLSIPLLAEIAATLASCENNLESCYKFLLDIIRISKDKKGNLICRDAKKVLQPIDFSRFNDLDIV